MAKAPTSTYRAKGCLLIIESQKADFTVLFTKPHKEKEHITHYISWVICPFYLIEILIIVS